MEELFFLVFLFIPSLAFRQQYIGVYGQLMCGTAPLSGTSLKLWSHKIMGLGYELAHNVTDRNGLFRIQGNDSSVLPLNVRLKIKHHCEAPAPCIRKLSLPLPPKFVIRGPSVTKWFDAGRLNVAYRFPDEIMSCGNKTNKTKRI